METPKNIVEKWAGPVVHGDRYFANVDDAVDWLWDDLHPGTDISKLPEYVECCDEEAAHLDAESIVESMDDYDHNCHSEDQYASQDVTAEQTAELQAFLDGWLQRVKWRCWQGNGKWIRIRDCFEQLAKEHAAESTTVS